jgi:hypothetical protein
VIRLYGNLRISSYVEIPKDEILYWEKETGGEVAKVSVFVSASYEQIPNYLKAVTILEPEGNIAAEVAAELDRWDTNEKRSFGGRSSSSRFEAEAGIGTQISSSSDFYRFGRKTAAGVSGALGAYLAGAGIVNAARR